MKKTEQHACRRCGKCCINGGPALHFQDMHILKSGNIKNTDLVCLRRGEPVFDNIRQKVIPLEKEIIKIRGTRNSTGLCIFYKHNTKTCGIYNTRPVQCRELKCWDTTAIEAIYDKNLITRAELPGKQHRIQEIIKDYEHHYSLEDLLELFDNLEGDQPTQLKKIHELCLDEFMYRTILVEKAGCHINHILFFLGRPWYQVLYGYDQHFRSTNFIKLFENKNTK